MTDRSSAAERVRVALQLHQDGVRPQLQNLRREHPDAPEVECPRSQPA